MVRRLSQLVAVLLVASFAACTGTSGDSGDNPGRGEWIVYSWNAQEFGPPQLYRIRPDGTQRNQLTDPVNRTNDEAAFSADGNQIVFSSQRDFPTIAQNPTLRMLCKTALDGIVQTKETANSPLHCSEHFGQFSPDAKMITFWMACDNIGLQLSNLELVYRVNTDGTGQVQVISDHPALPAGSTEVWPAFTPDGKGIVFEAESPAHIATFDLYVMDLDGKNTRRLTDLFAEGRTVLRRPAVVGDSVFFETISTTTFQQDAKIEAIKVDGTGRTVIYNIRNLTAPPNLTGVAEDRHFTVSANGRSMAFARFDPATGHEVLMSTLIDGTSPMVLDAGGYAELPAWK